MGETCWDEPVRILNTGTADDVAALWPAETLERLRQVKRTWDPENVFRRNFNVAP